MSEGSAQETARQIVARYQQRKALDDQQAELKLTMEIAIALSDERAGRKHEATVADVPPAPPSRAAVIASKIAGGERLTEEEENHILFDGV